MRLLFRATLLTAILGGLVLSPFGSLALADHPKELLLVVDMRTGQIHAVDPSGPTLVRSSSADILDLAGPTVAPKGQVLFVNSTGSLVSLDITTGKQQMLTTVPDVLRVIALRPTPLLVTPNGARLVIAHSRATGPGPAEEIMEFWVSVLVPHTGKLLYNIPPEPDRVKTSQAPACLIPQMLAAPDSRRLYELCVWAGSGFLHPEHVLRIVDLTNGEFLGTVTLPHAEDAALSPDGKRLYVLTVQGDLLVVDMQRLVIAETHVLSDIGGPSVVDYGLRILTGPDGKYLYLTDGQNPENLYSIELANWKVVARLRFQENDFLEDVAMDRNGQRLYVLTATGLTLLNAFDFHEIGKLNLANQVPLGGYRMLLVVPPPSTHALMPESGAAQANGWLASGAAGIVALVIGFWIIHQSRKRQ